MSQLLGLCPEILHGIFQEVNPESLASLSKTCRLLNQFIENDRLLWRDLYLRNCVCEIELHFVLRLFTETPACRITL